MTCAFPALTQAPDDADLRGLCLEHVAALVKSLPEEWLRNDSHILSGRNEPGSPPRDAFREYVRIVHQFERCENCPAIPRADAWPGRSNSFPLFSGRLGRDCYREARAAADEKFKLVPTIKLGVFDTSEEIDAAAITLQAAFLNNSAWVSEVNSWPRCEHCPTPARPTTTTGDVAVDRAVLEALTAHGVPMSASDLNALKIKGFSKNTSRQIMSRLLESGNVNMITRGPAKFYSLT